MEMTIEQVAEKVVVAISNQLDVTRREVIGSARIASDLGADSIDLVELAMEFEDEFGIEISDDDAEKLITVDDVILYIAGKLNLTI